MVVPLLIFVALVNIQVGQVSSKSGIFVGRPSMSDFLVIFLVWKYRHYQSAVE